MSRVIISFALAACIAGCVKSPRISDTSIANESTGSAASSRQKSPGLADALPATALLPDLRTVVPQQVQIVHAQQHDWLRFSNGVANTGSGALQLMPEFPTENPTEPQGAIQQILNASGEIVYEQKVSEFEFHPEHNHWHINAVALFELRKGSPAGPVVGGNSVKTTFCLIDWIKLEGNSPTKERVYWDCFGMQGISPGWVDQYHQSLEGQELDVTGVPSGRYYLVSTANPDFNMIESDYTNNVAWLSFDLLRDAKGNAKIKIVGHSACTGGLCGYSANR